MEKLKNKGNKPTKTLQMMRVWQTVSPGFWMLFVSAYSFFTASQETKSTTLMSRFFSFHVTLGLYIFLFQGNISPRLLPDKKKKKKIIIIIITTTIIGPLLSLIQRDALVLHGTIKSVQLKHIQCNPPILVLTVLFRAYFSCKTKIHRNIRGYVRFINIISRR